MKEVKSSTIHAVDHDGSKLTMHFKSGGVYDYPDVPKDLHDRMIAAHDAGESIGKFFHAHIRNNFKATKREAQ